MVSSGWVGSVHAALWPCCTFYFVFCHAGSVLLSLTGHHICLLQLFVHPSVLECAVTSLLLGSPQWSSPSCTQWKVFVSFSTLPDPFYSLSNFLLLLTWACCHISVPISVSSSASSPCLVGRKDHLGLYGFHVEGSWWPIRGTNCLSRKRESSYSHLLILFADMKQEPRWHGCCQKARKIFCLWLGIPGC